MVLIEDITQARHRHDADEDDDAFHDAASEESFEDATEHFNVESLPGAQRRAAEASTSATAHSDAAPAARSAPGAASSPTEQRGQQNAATAWLDEGTADAAQRNGQQGDANDALFGGPLPQYHHQTRESAAERPAEEAGAVTAADGLAADEPAADEPATESAEPLSPEEIEKRNEAGEALKQEGNALFGAGKWEEAQAKYSEALDAALPDTPQRATYFANRAAAAMKLQQWSNVASDCTSAIAIDGGYLKAFMRRAAAYEEADDLERALADHKKVLELDPGNKQAAARAAKLEPVVMERREKMKDEMIGKLKDLGNTVLGKFGMSVDNFKAVQGPDGSYSINFQQ